MNELQLNKIYNDDCLEGMKSLPNNSVDLILCDLPYNMTSISWDCLIPFDKLWEQYKRIIKPTGNIVLFSAGMFTYQLMFKERFIIQESFILYQVV